MISEALPTGHWGAQFLDFYNYFYTLLACIKCTKGFHCDISIHSCNVPCSNSPPLSFLLILPRPS
jgi:hypothetical protein